MPATYKDIQRLTGFSLATISKYFNGKGIKPATRKAIEKAVKKLNYYVNDFARGLKSRRAMAIGLLIPDINNLLCTNIMYRVSRIFQQHGYACFIYESNSDKKAESEAMSFFIRKSVDGVITIPFDANIEHLQAARSRNIPIVLLNRFKLPFKADTVLFDNYKAGKMTSEYLLSKGHKNVAIISGANKTHTMAVRQRGFLSTYSGEDKGYSTHIIESNFSLENSYQAVKDYFSVSRDCTALFSMSYDLTLGALTAMNELGIRFPRDISLICFDNLQYTRIIKPAITLVEQPLESFAQEAVRLLFKQLESESPQPYETVTLEPKFIEGESVADLSR